MAISDVKSFSSFAEGLGNKVSNMSTDVFKWVIIAESFPSIDEEAVNAKLADFTQVASVGNYIANSTIDNTTWIRVDPTTTLTGDDWVFAANALNPTTGKCILIYNDTSPNKSALQVVDMTVDGGITPANTIQGLTYTISGSGIYEIVRTV